MLNRVVEEANDDIKVSRAVRLAADNKIERAIERRANALQGLRAIGITPTLASAGDEG